MSNQSKKQTKEFYFISGLVSLIAGGILLGYGIEMIFPKKAFGICGGLGIALIISSFILQKTYDRLFILENKKADRDSRNAELENLKSKETRKDKMLNEVYDLLTNQIKADSAKYPKSFIKIIRNIV
jgi:hypothetical protein